VTLFIIAVVYLLYFKKIAMMGDPWVSRNH
jgi:hypothetical protein